LKYCSFILFTFLFFSFLYSGNPEKFFEVSDFDPSVFYETSIISDEAKLIYWKDGKIFYKDIFGKSKWKKLQDFNPDDFFIKVERQGKVNLIPISSIYNFYFLKNKSLCAFTTGLGTTPNTTVVVVDKKQNKIIFTPVLKEQTDKKTSPGIFMDRVWFNPSVSEDEKYLVCDGYKNNGVRIFSIFDISKKELIKEFENCAYPCIYKNKICFLKDDTKLKSVFLTVLDLNNMQEKGLEKITDRIIGLKIINDTVYIITDKNILSLDLNNSTKFNIVLKFNDYNKGYQIFSVENTFCGVYKGNYYLFIVIKKYKNDKYEWKIYAYKI